MDAPKRFEQTTVYSSGPHVQADLLDVHYGFDRPKGRPKEVA